MNKVIKKLSFLVASSAMLLTSGILAGKLALPERVEEDEFVDPIQYAEAPAKYKLEPKRADGDEPVAADVDTLVMHYHNDNSAEDYRFYIWTVTADGTEFVYDTISANKQDITITIDFTSATYADFKNDFDLRFIIKRKGTWDGQSDDTVISWTDFPPNSDKQVEVWIVNGVGSMLEVYDNEEDSKSDKVTDTYFSTFKKIHVVSTALPTAIRLYSYDQKYLAMSGANQSKYKETRLLKEYPAPTSYTTSGTGDNLRYIYDLTLNNTIHINIQYSLETEYASRPGKVHSTNVAMHKFYSYDGTSTTKTNMNRFDQYYTAKDETLGATWTIDSTIFKVWAPTAGLVKLNLYENGSTVGDDAEKGNDFKYASYQMVYMRGGVWAVEIEGDLDGFYYTYTVYNSLGRNEVVDPYAHACGANGRRGMVLDFSRTNPEQKVGYEKSWAQISQPWDSDKTTGGLGGDYNITTPQELSIYESHIRDLTMDDSWKTTTPERSDEIRGTYVGYIEKGTTLEGHTDIKTGFDHLDELGVNAIQFTPVFDHDNAEFIRTKVVDPVTGEVTGYEVNRGSYNWGYNPLNYNCVEGQYSTDPTDGAQRVKEFKEMVYALSQNSNHARSIMDVVYNHVASAPNSNFTKLMPRYYFRYTDNYTYWRNKLGWDVQPDAYFNGSGCSNEVKSEAIMMRKFIVDSLCWWAEEYNIKGFRFDLMALVDIETFKEAAKELYKIDPDIYLYGEGWTGEYGLDNAHVDETLYNQSSGSYKTTWGANGYCTYRDLNTEVLGSQSIIVGTFNDRGRDAIRGGNDRGGDDQTPESVKRLPGYGMMQHWNSEAGGENGNVIGMMKGDNYRYSEWTNEGNNDNPNWVQSKQGAWSQQTVNYASCHDNFALFDQFSATLKSVDAYTLCRATASTNIAIMLSNGVAFMQGGEELYRTKELSDEEAAKVRAEMDTDEKPEKHCETYVDIGDGVKTRHIAHNAYKSPDETNAFDWTRKYTVPYGNSTASAAAISHYFNALKDVIKLRKSLSYKVNPNASGDPNAWNYDSNNNDPHNASVCYFVGLKNTTTTKGYCMIVTGAETKDAGNKVFLASGHSYEVFASIGTPDTYTVVGGYAYGSSETYSCMVYRQY